jgi:hypothetical protein
MQAIIFDPLLPRAAYSKSKLNSSSLRATSSGTGIGTLMHVSSGRQRARWSASELEPMGWAAKRGFFGRLRDINRLAPKLTWT